MSASTSMSNHSEVKKPMTGISLSISDLQAEGARLLVDSLRKEIFAAQKNYGGSSTLSALMQEVSVALDGSKANSTSSVKSAPSIVTSKNHDNDNCNRSIGHTRDTVNGKPMYYQHHCSIVQSLYTLFTRVLATPVGTSKHLPDPDRSVVPESFNNGREGDDLTGNDTSSSARKQFPSFSCTPLCTSDQLLPLMIQSLRLLSSAASYDPS